MVKAIVVPILLLQSYALFCITLADMSIAGPVRKLTESRYYFTTDGSGTKKVPEGIFTYTFDTRGFLVESTEPDALQKSTLTHIYHNDELGKCIEEFVYNEQGRCIYKFRYTYNSLQEKTEVVWYTENGDQTYVFSRRALRYSDDGKSIEETTTGNSGEFISKSLIVVRAIEGVKTFTDYDEKGAVERRVVHMLDQRNNLSEIIWYSGNHQTPTFHDVFRYQLNGYGDWTVQDRLTNDRLENKTTLRQTTIAEREIEYY